MSTDYSKFRTPFYKISIGKPNATPSEMVDLPPQLAKLVERVEITETLTSETCIHDTITVVFIEGSREPFSTDYLDTKQVYPLGSNSKDTLTNRPGLLPDLNFSKGDKGVGITSVLPGVNNVVDDVTPASAKAFTSAINADNNDLKIITRETPVKPAQFLFQERNKVMVTWGYKEDEKNIKKAVGYIMMVQTDFPENDHPRTTITCLGPTAAVDQISTPKGRNHSQKINAGTDSKGKPVYNFKDKSTKEIIEEICNSANSKCIVSDTLFSELMDKYSSKVWAAGESFHQFLTKLANRHNAYYKWFVDPEDGKDTLLFVLKKDYDKNVRFSLTNLFDYKAPGSILKSLSIKADFSTITGHAETGLDISGKKQTFGANNGEEQIVMYKGAGQANTTPSDVGIVKSIVETLPGKKIVGRVRSNPESDDEKNAENLAKSKASCPADKIIQLEFSALGFPQLQPGPLRFGNIGQRYSGIYKVMTVTHVLEESGYTCKGTAQGNAIYSGGVNLPKAEKGQDKEKTVDVGLYAPINKQNSVDPKIRSGK